MARFCSICSCEFSGILGQAPSARIDTATKHRAGEALAAIGLSISDAIRLLMRRVVDERRLPAELKAPNATTREAISELEAGKGRRFGSTAALMAELNRHG